MVEGVMLLVAGDGNDVEAILKVVLLRTEVGLGSTHKFAYLLIVHSISRVVVLTLSRLHFDEYQHIILLRDNVDFDVSMHWLPITLSDNVALLYQVLGCYLLRYLTPLVMLSHSRYLLEGEKLPITPQLPRSRLR